MFVQQNIWFPLHLMMLHVLVDVQCIYCSAVMTYWKLASLIVKLTGFPVLLYRYTGRSPGETCEDNVLQVDDKTICFPTSVNYECNPPKTNRAPGQSNQPRGNTVPQPLLLSSHFLSESLLSLSKAKCKNEQISPWALIVVTVECQPASRGNTHSCLCNLPTDSEVQLTASSVQGLQSGLDLCLLPLKQPSCKDAQVDVFPGLQHFSYLCRTSTAWTGRNIPERKEKYMAFNKSQNPLT